MTVGVGGSLGKRIASYDSEPDDGWNGWLYPLLFIVLPIVACLMVIALIVCNLIEYYRKKRLIEHYEGEDYGDYVAPPPEVIPDKKAEIDYVDMNHVEGYNESQFTYNTIFGNMNQQQTFEHNVPPVRPMSGWNPMRA